MEMTDKFITAEYSEALEIYTTLVILHIVLSMVLFIGRSLKRVQTREDGMPRG
mgnify:CR=1 FL=1